MPPGSWIQINASRLLDPNFFCEVVGLDLAGLIQRLGDVTLVVHRLNVLYKGEHKELEKAK